MKVLVDTSVWSLALRRKGALSNDEQRLVRELLELTDQTRVWIAGSTQQEVLSGVASQRQFELLRKKLRAFVDVPTNRASYERAAEFYNLCREAAEFRDHMSTF